MIEPLPNCFSICASAAISALLLLSSIAFISLDFARERLMGRLFGDQDGPLLHRTNVRRQCPNGLGQTVEEALQRHPDRGFPDRRPVTAELSLKRLQMVRSGTCKPYRSDRFVGRAAVRPGNAGDGALPQCRGATEGSWRLLPDGLLADGAETLDGRWRYPKLLLLGQVGVGNESPLEPCRTARNRSDRARDQTSRTRLRRRDHCAARKRCPAELGRQRRQWVIDRPIHHRSEAGPRYQ